MIKSLFTQECLSVSVNRLSQDNKLRLCISSDFSGSDRKSQLYVNENRIAENVESFWKSIKTKNLLAMSVSFSEIDWYDDMTDVYETPIIRMERGLKKARIGHQDHGSIPKDWSVDAYFTFSDTTKNTPILEVVKSALGSYFNSDAEKKFTKDLKALLQKKTQRVSWEVEYEY
jgi:hypothetical protein